MIKEGETPPPIVKTEGREWVLRQLKYTYVNG